MSGHETLGRGASFPFRFGGSGGVASSDAGPPGHAKIEESIRHILSTRPGERFFLPEFGSRLHELAFQQNGAVLRALARKYVVDAVKRWEPRVKVVEVGFSEDPAEADRNRFVIRIAYEVAGSRAQGRLDFPFRREA